MHSDTHTHAPISARNYVRRSPTIQEAGPDPVDVHVGQRLRLRRSVLGLSQTDLGDAVGVTFQQVQKYERGTNRVSASRLFQIAKTLKVDIAFFFEGYEDPDFLEVGEQEVAPMKDPMNDNQFLELAAGFRKLDDTQRKAVISLVGTMRNG